MSHLPQDKGRLDATGAEAASPPDNVVRLNIQPKRLDIAAGQQDLGFMQPVDPVAGAGDNPPAGKPSRFMSLAMEEGKKLKAEAGAMANPPLGQPRQDPPAPAIKAKKPQRGKDRRQQTIPFDMENAGSRAGQSGKAPLQPPPASAFKGEAQGRQSAADAGQSAGHDREIAFCAREQILVTLPHSDYRPPEADGGEGGELRILVFRRKNGRVAMEITSGTDANGKPIGIPYGSIPRLLLCYIVSEINRTHSARVYLGKSLAELARRLGLESKSGGKKSGIRHLQEQLRRLLAARIVFIIEDERGVSYHHNILANRCILWWNPRDIGEDLQAELESWLEVTNAFYEIVTNKPVPVFLETVIALKKSPLAIDLYTLLCRESHAAFQKKCGRTIEWKWLREQLGSDYADLRHFVTYAKNALDMVCEHYPKLRVKIVRGGIEILADTQPDVDIKRR